MSALFALSLSILIIAVIAGWLHYRRARARRNLDWLVRRVKRGLNRPRYPLVLAHGLFGFDEIALRGVRHAYFRGVQERLEKLGWIVETSKVPASASIAVRAAELAKFVDELDAPRVNIVAHSMGGLDARYAISELGLADRVACLVTVGTPHRGTPLADIGVKLKADFALESLGVPSAALAELTPARMESFNSRIRNENEIAYFSIIGAPRLKRQLHPLLLPGFMYLSSRAGENDGVVPANSQEWGKVLHRIEADHWAQIGWSKGFDAAEFYVRLMRQLRRMGF